MYFVFSLLGLIGGLLCDSVSLLRLHLLVMHLRTYWDAEFALEKCNDKISRLETYRYICYNFFIRCVKDNWINKFDQEMNYGHFCRRKRF